MENNIIHHANGTIIFNGGNPLPGCPESWEQAAEIEAKFNEGKNYDREEDFKEQPVWTFDCGYKLDFDGPLIDVSSRFYPPKTHYGATWDGRVSIRIFGETIQEKKFDCVTLEELRTQVESYVQGIKSKVSDFLTQDKEKQ